MKICAGCGLSKPLSEFSAERRVNDGCKSRCKPCLAAEARGKRNEYFREFHRKNKERRNAWMRDNFDRLTWQRDRRKDPRHRIDGAMGMRLHSAIHHKKGGRKWSAIVGYSRDELIEHLSKKFQPGMSLENYGEWHIDHIRPIASFNYVDDKDPEFLKCWTLENLQPLWAIDNLKKSDRILF